jgi:hypothetical protein
MWKEEVLALPGVRGFHAGADVSYPFRYDLITVCHVLEHVPNPAAFLRPLVANLAPSGRRPLLAFRRGEPRPRATRLRVAGDGPQRACDPEGIDRDRGTRGSWSDEPAVPADKLCRDYFRLFDGVREAARAARAEASCFGISGRP